MAERIVLDTSVVMAWLMPDEVTDATGNLDKWMNSKGAIVPSLWRIELGNSLLVACRRGRISHEQRTTILQVVSRFPVSVDKFTQRQVPGDTLALADKHGLTLYDATYLELAVRTGAGLATYDKALQRAAQAEGILYL